MAARIVSSVVMVSPQELPFACPPPSQRHWNLHPRVYLPLTPQKPNAACPYCGARYALQAPEEAEESKEPAKALL
jgi:uncharacterized Zn-finger protein